LTPEDSDIFDALIFGLSSGKVRVNLKDGKFVLIDIENGVLSGWRWTALLDTIINIATFRLVEELVNNFVKLRPIEYLAQGDDGAIKLDSLEYVNYFLEAYSYLGFKVNPQKNYYSKTRDEFLRRCIEPDLVTGYPARAITAIVFEKRDVAGEEVDNQSRLFQVMSAWHKLANRLRKDFVFIEHLAVEHLCKAASITKEQARDWIHTPRVLGGAGMRPYCKARTIPIKIIEVEEPSVIIDSAIHKALILMKNKYPDLENKGIKQFISQTLVRPESLHRYKDKQLLVDHWGYANTPKVQIFNVRPLRYPIMKGIFSPKILPLLPHDKVDNYIMNPEDSHFLTKRFKINWLKYSLTTDIPFINGHSVAELSPIINRMYRATISRHFGKYGTRADNAVRKTLEAKAYEIVRTSKVTFKD